MADVDTAERNGQRRAGERHDVERGRGRAMTRALWITQALLALIFLYTGGIKLVSSIAAMQAMMPLPGPFIRFIGVAELLGAFGLILPALLRIRPFLTPLAASGLVIIMIGAVVCTLKWFPPLEALMPLVVGCLAAFVAYGRWRLAPITDRASGNRQKARWQPTI